MINDFSRVRAEDSGGWTTGTLPGAATITSTHTIEVLLKLGEELHEASHPDGHGTARHLALLRYQRDLPQAGATL